MNCWLLAIRIAVMYHGTLSASFENGSKTIAEIGLMMAGHGNSTAEQGPALASEIGVDRSHAN